METITAASMAMPQFQQPAHSPSSAPVSVKKAKSQDVPTLKADKCIEEPSPVSYLQTLFQHSTEGQKFLKRSLKHTFSRPSQEALDSYDVDAVRAIRSGDVEKLRSMIAEGRSLDASNRFGESLIHMACRRGDEKLVRLLILEGNVKVDVRDDFGRTPLHDACWTSKPNFAVLELILKACSPEMLVDLLLAEDVRGHTPFHYARREHWEAWVEFLEQRSGDLIQLKLSSH